MSYTVRGSSRVSSTRTAASSLKPLSAMNALASVGSWPKTTTVLVVMSTYQPPTPRGARSASRSREACSRLSWARLRVTSLGWAPSRSTWGALASSVMATMSSLPSSFIHAPANVSPSCAASRFSVCAASISTAIRRSDCSGVSPRSRCIADSISGDTSGMDRGSGAGTGAAREDRPATPVNNAVRVENVRNLRFI